MASELSPSVTNTIWFILNTTYKLNRIEPRNTSIQTVTLHFNISAMQSIQKRVLLGGLEREHWEEHWLLFQRTWVQVSAPTL